MDEGEIILKRVVSIDIAWVRSFEPELKGQSSEWHTPNSSRPVKFCHSLNNPKLFMIYDCDISRFLPRIGFHKESWLIKNIMSSF